MAPLLQSEFTRPLLVSLLAPALVGQIQTSDCGAIDHMITLLQPLPPRNTAGLVVSALELIREKQAAGALDTRLPTLDLPLCRAQRRCRMETILPPELVEAPPPVGIGNA